MLNLIPLLQNENMKIYRRPRTWIMMALVIVILVIMVLINKYDPPKGYESGMDNNQRLEQRIAANETMLKESREDMDESSIRNVESSILKDRYALENNIDTSKTTLWNTVLMSANLISLLSIFTIVIAADSVAGEFSGGTIKLLLIRPIRRWKILLSKYLASLLFALFGLALLFTCAMLIGGITYGFDGSSIPYLTVDNGRVVEQSMFVQALKTYGYSCVSLLMMATFAFMISSSFRSSSMAIGLSIGLMFMGDIVVFVLRKYEWVKYILFANMDLRQYLEGTPIVEGMTLSFSVMMLAIYFVVFNAVAWLLFTKRDVAA